MKMIFFESFVIICTRKIFRVKFLMNEEIFKSALSQALELTDEFTDIADINTVGNSFFDRSYFGTRILILAPRIGDEIAVAGNMILNLTAAKAEIFIAYSNQAWTDELAAVTKILNVKRDKIIFLDADNLQRDLKKNLLELRANIIFCADFDTADEYKKLSATFENVMGEILIETHDYKPEVYKKFALATAINTIPDFYATNLFSTRKPKIGVTDGYDFDIIDRANYSWENRVRFPINESCRKTLLKDNPLADAILACKSRRKELSPLKILNSDEIFFERRTDNQICYAKSLSADAEKIRDFKIYGECTCAKNFEIDFEEAVQVRRIAIYGNAFDAEPAQINLRLELDNFHAAIDKAGIYLDNTKDFNINLPARGLPAVIDVEKIFVKRAEFTAVNFGKNFGIGEVEFFANVNPLRKIPPFIKLCIGKDFFYTYLVPYEIEKIPLSLYRFHVDEPVKICAHVEGENILTEVLTDDAEIILNMGNAKEIVLTAEVVGDPNIYDNALIRRAGDVTQIQLKVLQWIDKVRG